MRSILSTMGKRLKVVMKCKKFFLKCSVANYNYFGSRFSEISARTRPNSCSTRFTNCRLDIFLVCPSERGNFQKIQKEVKFLIYKINKIHRLNLFGFYSLQVSIFGQDQIFKDDGVLPILPIIFQRCKN